MTESRDYLKKMITSRASYADSGIEWGDAQEGSDKKKGKLSIDNSPMFITNMSPGVCAKKPSHWQQTYGASKDSYLSLLEGKSLMENKTNSQSNFESPHLEGLPLADNSNIYESIGGRQQIQFIMGRAAPPKTMAEAAVPVEDFEARSLCLRGPMHLCGWGKTITMRPTDPEPEDKRVNDPEHKMDRSTWPVGPVDVRWDSKRGMWRAFNDLIADDEGKNLGTFVYSTNKDDVAGFPFLRAKLEDIWSVRQHNLLSDTGDIDKDIEDSKENDTTKTGKLCIKIGTYVMSGAKEAKLGQFSDVLTVIDTCEDGQETVPTPHECGDDKTTIGFLGIHTLAQFIEEEEVAKDVGSVSETIAAGPISFISEIPKDDDDLLFGDMYYFAKGDKPCAGEWRPGIFVDLCDSFEDELEVFYDNDVLALNERVGLCERILADREEMFDFVKNNYRLDAINTNNVVAALREIAGDSSVGLDGWDERLRVEIAQKMFDADIALASSTSLALTKTASEIINGIKTELSSWSNKLVAAINECLPEDCKIDVPPPEFLTTLAVPPIAPKQIELLENAGVETIISTLENVFFEQRANSENEPVPRITQFGPVNSPCDQFAAPITGVCGP